MKKINPLFWVPTLYFAEGIPYFIVNNISVLIFTKMGVPNGQMALFTSLLYLPWTIKPLWSPFVDIIRTKRWWIITMQIIMAAAMGLTALTIPNVSQSLIETNSTPISLFTLTLILFIITAFASATHDIAADGFYMLALSNSEQSSYIGFRSLFYRLSNIFCNSALVLLAGYLESKTTVPIAWKITLFFTALLFTLIALYHCFITPKPEKKNDTQLLDAKQIFSEFIRTFITFFRKKGILLGIIFMLLYRLPEAFMLKMVSPFMFDKIECGGMEISTEMYGIIYGIGGVVALLLGGIIGGFYATKFGLKRSLLPMASALVLPCAVYIYFAYLQPDNLILMGSLIAIEQFGYGFGFTAYMLYMIYISEGEFKTSHYALCTAFMALSMMIPGAIAGYLQEWMGYKIFFDFVLATGILTFAVTLVVREKIE